MIKVAFLPSRTESGPSAIPLFGPADSYFEKTAAPKLLPEVVRYIETLQPRNDAQYSLVNAMGAGEYWSSNVNGDHFPEAALIHAPDDWTHNPLIDKIKAKNWPYGYPTFYYAHPFAHHVNKNSERAYGEVELAAWNQTMKRVELVTRVDKDKCERFGGTAVWDRLKIGEYADVSMGAKVPFDTCSICLDWPLYRKAQATFDPKKFRHSGEAVLAFHKALQAKNGKGIRGVSITRNDYCDHAKNHMNEILPDGRKVFVYNDYPRFFDISFVFIGADKTAKVMMKIAGATDRSYWFMGGAELADKLGYSEEEKTAAAIDKAAKDKASEIVKDTVPSQFTGKAVPLLTKAEEDLPDPVLDRMGDDAVKSLATATSLGMVMRPREFQRIILVQLGQKPLADRFDDEGIVFPKSDQKEDLPLSSEDVSSSVLQLLLPFFLARSSFGPLIERRVHLAPREGLNMRKHASSLSSELMCKLSAAYNGYRNSVMELVANAQALAESNALPRDRDLLKIAAAPVETVFTPLTAAFLKISYMDEFGISPSEYKESLRGEGFPLEEHAAIRRACGGH